VKDPTPGTFQRQPALEEMEELAADAVPERVLDAEVVVEPAFGYRVLDVMLETELGTSALSWLRG